jgi:hypothetical protein
MAQEWPQWRALVKTVMNLLFLQNACKYLSGYLLRKTKFHGVIYLVIYVDLTTTTTITHSFYIWVLDAWF